MQFISGILMGIILWGLILLFIMALVSYPVLVGGFSIAVVVGLFAFISIETKEDKVDSEL
jgi:hypothetical protein